MAKTSVIRARIEPDLKDEVETIFHELGLSTTEAVTLFYRQVKLRNGLPFEVAVPNEVTIKTFQETDAGENLVACQDKEDLFEKLEL
ncbi:MAG: type II toxin-antitoxin system RelB/DinJ family antitoxin [Chloroflexota bacterium]